MTTWLVCEILGVSNHLAVSTTTTVVLLAQEMADPACTTLLGLKLALLREISSCITVGQTPCQRSRTNALVSSWRRNGSQLNVTTAPDLFIPSCLEASGLNADT